MITRNAILVLAAASGGCLAQSATNDVLQRMLDHYKSLDGCSVTVGIKMDSEDPMLKAVLASMGQTTPGYALKPNKFAFWNEAKADGAPAMGMPIPALFCDGEEVVAAVQSLSIYSREEAPESFDALIAAGPTEAPWQMIPATPFVFALMSADPAEAIGTLLSQTEYKGLEGEGDQRHHVFTTMQTNEGEPPLKMEMHVSADDEPWLIALKPDLTGSGAPEGLEVLMTFDGWKEIASAPEEGVIHPAEDWKQVESIQNAVMESMGLGDQGADEPETPAAEAQDKPAPAFTLPRLGGDGAFSLADHKGEVVVIDFWATWCGPCIRGLPTVTKVTSELADKGVTFVAVDLQEEADHVAQFMKDKGWNFTVALDADGSVADLFGVTGIPHSVIVDRKGVVRHVHVGFGNAEEYEARLRSELEALIAEK